MRIHVKTTPAKELIGFNHLHLMSGTLHKWIGENNFHDDISLYSFSKLSGGKATKKGLSFSEGADFFISCWDNDLAKCIIAGIQQDTDMFSGLKVVEIVLQEDPDLSSRGKFNIASPIFIQRNVEEGRKKFYFYDDEESSELMMETLHHKMKVAGLPYDESLTISFDQSYPRKGTKLLSYKKGDSSIQLRASWCPVIIEGKPETKAFAWNVGIGNSTGIGFGAIK